MRQVLNDLLLLFTRGGDEDDLFRYNTKDVTFIVIILIAGVAVLGLLSLIRVTALMNL